MVNIDEQRVYKCEDDEKNIEKDTAIKNEITRNLQLMDVDAKPERIVQVRRFIDIALRCYNFPKDSSKTRSIHVRPPLKHEHALDLL